MEQLSAQLREAQVAFASFLRKISSILRVFSCLQEFGVSGVRVEFACMSVEKP